MISQKPKFKKKLKKIIIEIKFITIVIMVFKKNTSAVNNNTNSLSSLTEIIQ